MKNKKIGLELSGIIITYTFNTLIAIGFLRMYFEYDYYYDVFPFFSILWVLSLIPVALYHLGVIKNHYIAGFVALFTNFIGGLFILTYEDNLIKKNYLEISLKELKRLLDENVITKTEFDQRRANLLQKFL